MGVVDLITSPDGHMVKGKGKRAEMEGTRLAHQQNRRLQTSEAHSLQQK